jgi:hypothetical protein
MNKAELRYILHKQTTVQYTRVYFRGLESLQALNRYSLYLHSNPVQVI